MGCSEVKSPWGLALPPARALISRPSPLSPHPLSASACKGTGDLGTPFLSSDTDSEMCPVPGELEVWAVFLGDRGKTGLVFPQVSTLQRLWGVCEFSGSHSISLTLGAECPTLRLSGVTAV